MSLRRASLRLLLLTVASLAALTGLAGSAGAQTTARPLQGVYEGCNSPVMRTDCITRLQHIKDMGFGVVLNYTAFSAHVPDLQAYMAAAERIGVKLIWSFKDPYWWTSQPAAPSLGQLNSACGCTTDDQLLQFIVNLVKDSPATWGYYVGDETSLDQVDAQKAFSTRLHQLDPDHPRLFVGIGDYEGVRKQIAPFASSAEVLGADFYPVGLNRPLSQVKDVSQRMSSYAASVGKQSAMVLQAFNWSLYKDTSFAPSPAWPTRQQMRQMRDYAVAGGADDLILWFNYYKMTQQANATQLFGDLAWAANGGGGPDSSPTPQTSSSQPKRSGGSDAPTTTNVLTSTAPAAPSVSAGPAATPATFVALKSSPQVQIQAAEPKLSGGALKLARVRCTAKCTLTLQFAPVGTAARAARSGTLKSQRLALGGRRAGTVVVRGSASTLKRVRAGQGRVRVAVTAKVGRRASRATFEVSADGRLSIG